MTGNGFDDTERGGGGGAFMKKDSISSIIRKERTRPDR